MQVVKSITSKMENLTSMQSTKNEIIQQLRTENTQLHKLINSQIQYQSKGKADLGEGTSI